MLFFPPGKDTGLGSALPADPVKAVGGTGTSCTMRIGTRIISRSGTGSMNGIGTGTERGTGTTETGESRSRVSLCRWLGTHSAAVLTLLLFSLMQKFVSKSFLMDSYLLTLTRTTPLTLLHPLSTTHGSFGAPKGLPDTSWPWGLSPCSHPLLLLFPGERLKARGPCSVNTWTQREMVLYFHGRKLVSPFLSQPSRSGCKWMDPWGHRGSEACSFPFQLEESWAGVTPFTPTFTAGLQPLCSSHRAAALSARSWWGLT